MDYFFAFWYYEGVIYFIAYTMDQTTKPEGNASLEEGNIFDEFVQSQKVGSDIQKMQEVEERDFFFYAGKIHGTLLGINILLFFLIFLGFLYLYIQNGATKKEYAFLKPVCSLLLGKSEFWQGTCYGMTPILQEYQAQLTTQIQNQTKIIAPILWELYGIENFHKSKKVEFLKEAEYTRLRPIKILSAFDALKNQFSPNDKADIQCSQISISQDQTLSLRCSVYSSDWDTKIVGLDGDTLSFLPNGGTAITRASSFINFLENKTDSPFTVREKTRTFVLEDANLPPYTKKTDIDLVLEYNDTQNLLF